MRRTCLVMLVWVVAVAGTYAQAPSDLQIRLGLYMVSSDGGEKASGGWYVNRVAIGKAETSTFSAGAKCDAWAISARTGLRDDAITAWRIETTPLRIAGNAVTFRLRWIHVTSLQQQVDQLSFDNANASRLPGQDIELTLRPGESWEVDRFPLPKGVDVHGKPCALSASIRAVVDVYPGPEEERRLVVADLWLVERLPNGTEAQRSQPLTVRGLPNRPFRFYFDSLVDGNSTLDIFGSLTAAPEGNTVALSVDTRSRWAPESRNISGPQRFLTSQIEVKPAETVDVRLPLLGEEAGPFAKRALSIRIRARQLR
jgi:hypothetical protein